MKNIILSGRENRYWLGLMDYINKQGEMCAYLCTDPHGFSRAMEEKDIEMLFCAEEESSYGGLDIPVIRFSSDREKEGCIYWYQPVDRIYEEMYQQVYKTKSAYSRAGNDKLYAVYSPIGRSGKTSFACAYARKHSFFYLGMEEYGTVGHNRMSMDKVFYYIKTRREDITMYLRQASEEWEGIRVISSASSFSDLRMLTGEDIVWFFDKIRKDADFPAAIVDLGTGCLFDLEILDCFDCVYIPVLEYCGQEGKLERFRELLYEVNGKMKDKIVTILVPDLSWKEGDFLEQVQYRKGLRF